MIRNLRGRLVPFFEKKAKADPKKSKEMVQDHLVINRKPFYYEPVSNVKEKRGCAGRPKKRNINTKTAKETKSVFECATDFEGVQKCESNTGDRHAHIRKARANCNSTDFGALDAESVTDTDNTACVTCEYQF